MHPPFLMQKCTIKNSKDVSLVGLSSEEAQLSYKCVHLFAPVFNELCLNLLLHYEP